jgi:ATP-dependent DNA helicase RecG
MFLMIGGGERAGSGADKIRAGWRAQHWRAPRVESRCEPDRVRLTLPMVSLIPEETHQRLRSHFGSKVDTLAPSEVQALATADIEGAVSNVRLQELLTDHSVDITRMLHRLCEQGFLESDNRRRWTTYRIDREGITGLPLFDQQHSPHKAGDLPLKTGDSAHLDGDSAHLDGDSAHLATGLDELRHLAMPVSDKGKVAPELIRKVILKLCENRYLTADELGNLLNRNVNGLRSRYLSPMVREGLLRLRFPATANRPDQAYTTAMAK